MLKPFNHKSQPRVWDTKRISISLQSIYRMPKSASENVAIFWCCIVTHPKQSLE